ncbi:MAG: division/cell wall cluster transcriptional repressor MraZ [Euzebyales bacterium]|nr:division/cell wall cluster transcriptional repressor MraZ [Euzebyales bacterium]
MAVADPAEDGWRRAMFVGEYQHTLDPKGRVILPSAFRDELTDGVVMTVGLDNSVAVHSPPHWEQVVQQLRALRTTAARERRFVRMMMASAHPQQLDRQGRLSVPARLRTYAGLTKDVAVVGNDEHLELWDATRWSEYRDAGLADFADTEQPFGQGLF